MGVGLIVGAEAMRGQLGRRVRHEDLESKLIGEGEFMAMGNTNGTIMRVMVHICPHPMLQQQGVVRFHGIHQMAGRALTVIVVVPFPCCCHIIAVH